ncbi:MAG: hypothetical protein COB07_12890 [Sulfurovum sp.]|nr:MAG: hypothetical protein COB07_12890 [Sulfurovum sp.]
MIAKSFAEAIMQMMEEIAKCIPDEHKQAPVKSYLTGGGAVHFYCNKRVSDDVDIIMQYAVTVPDDLFVVWLNEDGILEEVHYDHTYNSTLGLLQEDYEDRATHLATISDKFEINLLSPEDLIISKLVRFASKDEEDISNIIQTGKVSKERLYELAEDAINVGVGFQKNFVEINLDIVMDICNQYEKGRQHEIKSVFKEEKKKTPNASFEPNSGA